MIIMLIYKRKGSNMEKVTAAELKNQYQREWRKKNPEATKKHIADYWERKADKLNQANKEPRMDNNKNLVPLEANNERTTSISLIPPPYGKGTSYS